MTRNGGRGTRDGYTLPEVIVVLAILGLVFGIAGPALASLKMPRESEAVTEFRRARADAIRSGAPRTTQHVLFLPDGRAIGAGVDPLTGAPRAK